MPFARLDRRGRVAVPKSVQERLGLRAGDRVEFVVEDDGTVRVRRHSVDLMSLVGMFKADRHVTVEKMNAAVARSGREVTSRRSRRPE